MPLIGNARRGRGGNADADGTADVLTTLIPHNGYFMNKLPRFIPAKNPIIHFTKNYAADRFKKWDILVVYWGDIPDVKREFRSRIPLYAVIGPDYVVITKAIMLQIYEVGKTRQDFINMCLYEMGAVVGQNIQIKNYAGVKFPKIYEIKKTDCAHFAGNRHGWLSLNTKYTLRYVLRNIIHRQAPVIVELGSWLGCSTIEILDSSKNAKVYCFDKFQNVALTDYKFTNPHPLDDFWIKVPRYETFCRNVAGHIKSNKLYTVKYDVNKSTSVLRANKIMPDVVFIDAIKNPHKLESYLRSIFAYNPDVVVVGDDYVFDSVKKAVAKFAHLNLFTASDCYILTKRSLNTAAINDFIVNEVKSDTLNYLAQLLITGQYDSMIRIMNGRRIDVNKPLQDFNNNTLYTLIVIEIYSKKNKRATVIHDFVVSKYSPKKIKNYLFLTYQDYINTHIEF